MTQAAHLTPSSHTFNFPEFTADAETIGKQNCSGFSFWFTAQLVGMCALALFGVFLVIEWPAIAVPVVIIFGANLAIDGLNLFRSCLP
ncbi:MAG: hypothetical protein HYX48_05225 [Chlamydiales bacterium]|nr:hypothetical protein [Chlamydiales bacterium]